MATAVEAAKHSVGRAMSLSGVEADRYLAFRLEGEQYGIDILKVQEILQVVSITRVPRVPAYVTGVMNLRGQVIPILDLKKKFGMYKTEYGRMACIIVINTRIKSDKLVMGALVDEVYEVMRIAAADIHPPPAAGQDKQAAGFISGLGRVEERVIALMDIERVLGSASQEMLAGLAVTKPAVA